ncbi:GumC family protein [Egbenema bharatensis]|uniref:GumC family protein n=1 Tax=Egbenema bharatensis TaxID=3463334 RepID=UPI003A896E6B
MVATPPKSANAMVSVQAKLASAATHTSKGQSLEFFYRDHFSETVQLDVRIHDPLKFRVSERRNVVDNQPQADHCLLGGRFESGSGSEHPVYLHEYSNDHGDNHLDAQGDEFESLKEPEDCSIHRSTGIPRQAGIAAGVVVAVTAGTIGQVVNQAPQYEGSFQLGVQAEADTEGTEPIPTPQIEDTNQRITDTHVRILQSHKLIEPIVEQLRSENPQLNYRDFTRNLNITRTSEQTLEITYRDTDPERLKQVLAQLAHTYVDYGQECRSESCKGLQFIETQIPQIQQKIAALRDEIQDFHQQYGLKNLEAQVRIFSTRAAEVAQQQAEITGKQAEARQKLNELQARMALSPEESIAQTLLEQDSRYQSQLQQFRQLDRQIAMGLSTYRAAGTDLAALEEQHRGLVEKLHEEAGQVLARHINHPEANLQDPVFQDPALLELLQQAIGTIHYLNILEIRQQTIQQAETEITERKQELAVILRHYADLRQKLQAKTQILQQYFDRQNLLEAQTMQQDAVWQVVAEPELATNAEGQPKADYLHNLRNDFASAAILGVMMGVAVGVVAEEKRRPGSASRLMQTNQSHPGDPAQTQLVHPS